VPEEPQTPAPNVPPKAPALSCPLRRQCSLARHHVITSLVTCLLPKTEACEKQVVFGPDAFCGLLLTPVAADGERAP
jgi:hypothetical protein